MYLPFFLGQSELHRANTKKKENLQYLIVYRENFLEYNFIGYTGNTIGLVKSNKSLMLSWRPIQKRKPSNFLIFGKNNNFYYFFYLGSDYHGFSPSHLAMKPCIALLGLTWRELMLSDIEACSVG